MYRIKKDFSIEITKNTGCFNNPHYFILKCKEPKEVIKAIQLKFSLNYWCYEKDNWKIDIDNNYLRLEKGIKTIDNIDSLMLRAKNIMNKYLDITSFEINVAMELLKNGI